MVDLVRKNGLAISRQRYAFFCANCSIHMQSALGNEGSIIHPSQVCKIIFYLLLELPESALVLQEISYKTIIGSEYKMTGSQGVSCLQCN